MANNRLQRNQNMQQRVDELSISYPELTNYEIVLMVAKEFYLSPGYVRNKIKIKKRGVSWRTLTLMAIIMLDRFGSHIDTKIISSALSKHFELSEITVRLKLGRRRLNHHIDPVNRKIIGLPDKDMKEIQRLSAVYDFIKDENELMIGRK